MRTKLLAIVAIGPVVVLLTTTRPALAHSADGPAAHRLGLEVDPLPFFAHGFSVHAEYKPAPLSRLRLTLGAFGFRAEADQGTTNSGFTKTTRAVEISAQYFVVPYNAGGLFAGAYVFGYANAYDYAGIPETAHRYTLVPTLAAGFQWLPWSKGPYLTPWAAVGRPLKQSDEAVIAGHRYEEAALVFVLALHVGWEFAL